MPREKHPTIKQHLETLPEPYRAQALKNCKHTYILKGRSRTLALALYYAFDWDQSPEGRKYWGGVLTNIVLKNG